MKWRSSRFSAMDVILCIILFEKEAKILIKQQQHIDRKTKSIIWSYDRFTMIHTEVNNFLVCLLCVFISLIRRIWRKKIVFFLILFHILTSHFKLDTYHFFLRYTYILFGKWLHSSNNNDINIFTTTTTATHHIINENVFECVWMCINVLDFKVKHVMI